MRGWHLDQSLGVGDGGKVAEPGTHDRPKLDGIDQVGVGRQGGIGVRQGLAGGRCAGAGPGRSGRGPWRGLNTEGPVEVGAGGGGVGRDQGDAPRGEQVGVVGVLAEQLLEEPLGPARSPRRDFTSAQAGEHARGRAAQGDRRSSARRPPPGRSAPRSTRREVDPRLGEPGVGLKCALVLPRLVKPTGAGQGEAAVEVGPGELRLEHHARVEVAGGVEVASLREPAVTQGEVGPEVPRVEVDGPGAPPRRRPGRQRQPRCRSRRSREPIRAPPRRGGPVCAAWSACPSAA